MAKAFQTMLKVFLDTSFAIALSAVTDKNHSKAIELANQLESSKTRFVTTQAILLEIGNSLARQKYRVSAIRLLESLQADPLVEIVVLTDDLYVAAFNLFKSRKDKEWGLVDCLSFVVMKNMGLIEALTADEHFQQAGFRALLK